MASGMDLLPSQKKNIMPESTPVDWQCGKPLIDCLQHICSSGTASDVTFIVGEDEKKISAHKLILISRSPVFYAMFEGALPEKGDVVIPDIQDTIFKTFLGYLYTDRINLTVENVVPVLSVAMKYCVDILISVCEDFLVHNLSVDNVCTFLEEAHVFHIDKLTTDCLQLIKGSAPASLRAKSFTTLCPSCMSSIVNADDLDAEESDVYLAITKWAEAECFRKNIEVTSENRREVLGNMLFLARFNTMDLNFLLQRVFLDNILTSDLAVKVVNYQMHQVKSGLTDCRRRRQTKTKARRYSEILRKHYTQGYTTEKVSFQISGRAVLHGFGSFFTCEEPSTSDVEIYKGERRIHVERHLSLVKETEELGEVILGKPIFLTAGTQYSVIEKPSAEKKYSFRRSTDEVVFRSGSVTFKRENEGNKGGNIPYIILTKVNDYGQKNI
ncbi:BTB/POZ domain-containing protein 6-like [Ylistrum balloti]|uniref:BTB/POZ domain-containing protein 6-like n=1 Tax=Ylistrum balloti TaxID=509963 RepID=UPI0029057D8E|nr:BTB/POZ domain-containing protein 6-like [Ylistrum balloti]